MSTRSTAACIAFPSGGSFAGGSVSGPTPGTGGLVTGPNLPLTNHGYLVINGGGMTTLTNGDDCHALVATNAASVLVENITLSASGGTSCSDVFSQNSATVQIGPGVTFGSASHSMLHAEANALIEMNGCWGVPCTPAPFTINGTVGQYGDFMEASNGGYIEFDGNTVANVIAQFSGGSEFAYAGASASIDLGGPSNSWVNAGGSVCGGAGMAGAACYAGPPYYVWGNSTIDRAGGGSLPGTGNGSWDSGGKYLNPALTPTVAQPSGIGGIQQSGDDYQDFVSGTVTAASGSFELVFPESKASFGVCALTSDVPAKLAQGYNPYYGYVYVEWAACRKTPTRSISATAATERMTPTPVGGTVEL